MAQTLFRPAIRWIAVVLALALTVAFIPGLNAQSDQIYFPQTGHHLGGAFRYFWETNGGVEIFGYPITEEYTPSGGSVTQYFERARFELVLLPDGQATVRLGKLGAEVTQGRVFPKVPPIENSPDRRYIPQTQHIIQYGFKEIWETRGAERIFGYPISEEIKEVLEDGEWHTVQYFENVRFEYWPNFAPGKRVVISMLGRRLAPPELIPPVPPGQPGAPAPGPTAPALPPVPASVNATVTPQSGPPGTVFLFVANGFQAGERVGIWITAPDQSTFGAGFQANADGEGSIASEQITLTTDNNFPDGIWSFNAQGVESKREAIGYFRISRSESALPAGDPGRLGVILHDSLPREGGAFITPLAGPPGVQLRMFAPGYTPGETVSAWITDANGQSTPLEKDAVSVGEGGVVEVAINSAGMAEGVYAAVAQGQSSDKIAVASFKLTRDYVAGPATPLPASVNGSVTPSEGGPGTTFMLRGQGLQAGELLDFWFTDPNGIYLLFPDPAQADGAGRVGFEPALDLQATAEAQPGIYGVHFRGRNSGTRVDFYFRVVGAPRATGGQVMLHKLEVWAR